MSEKDSIPSKLWDIVTTFTDSAQQAAVRRAMELSFDLEVGQIPFQETLINLSHDREVLRDAIEKGRIVQLPLKLQYRLLTEATKVKGQLDSLSSGVDAVLPLENAVDDLSATIWQFNLQNISENVLAFDSKMNELKSQEAQIKKVLSEARRLEKAISRLNEIENEASEKLKDIHNHAEHASQQIERFDHSAQAVQEAERSALGAVSIVKEHEDDISRAGAASREASAEIVLAAEEAGKSLAELSETQEAYTSLKEQAKALLGSIEASTKTAVEGLTSSFDDLDAELRSSIGDLVRTTSKSIAQSIEETSNQLETTLEVATSTLTGLETTTNNSELERLNRATIQLASSKKQFADAIEDALDIYGEKVKELETEAELNINNHDEEAKRLTEHLGELEGRIHKSIERATGYTLFHSFQKRQHDLETSKLKWLFALLGCVSASVCLSWFFIHSLGGIHEVNALFFMKLSISLPIIFAITFCSVQYSKDRRLEEEYAFKSSISISLEPYQKLVEQLIDKADPEEKAKYTAFIISSINKVFTSPTGLVFDSDEKGGDSANSLLKTAGSIAETIIKSKVK